MLHDNQIRTSPYSTYCGICGKELKAGVKFIALVGAGSRICFRCVNPQILNAKESANSAEETQPYGENNNESNAIAFYTLNCEVCGVVIYRKAAFDVRCDKHPWE